MNYNVFALDEFKKNAKKLSKRYKKIKLDILELETAVSEFDF